MLASLTVADTVLSPTQHGFLQTGEAWQGAELATATVIRDYDNDFRVADLQVNEGTPTALIWLRQRRPSHPGG